jgi:hypothetical protein
MSAGFNPCTSATLQGLCERTVYYGVASNLTVKSWLTLRLSQGLGRFTKTRLTCRSTEPLYGQELDTRQKKADEW